MSVPSRFALIVPVRNGGDVWRRAAAAIREQAVQPERVLVVDSESADASVEVAREQGFEVLPITARDFDHGGTRQMAAELCRDFEFLVYMTQDAVLAGPHSLEALLRAFADKQVAIAYGRQLPRREAGPIEAHARLFNYPATSQRRLLADAAKLGMKAAFTSNSYCAYRTAELFGVGGFPRRAIVSEDMVVAARSLQAGRAISYVAEACAYHSHGYTLMQEFQRYFDIGVLHRNEQWLLRDFGKPDGEGARFVRSESAYLMGRAPLRLPEAWVRNAFKLLAYKAGRRYQSLPCALRRRWSMNRGYWPSGGNS